MLHKIKRTIAVLIILILLPYIITIFINGTNEEKEDHLLREHCISILSREVSPHYEDEMLKVQAVLVRTTIYKEIQEKGSSYREQEEFGKKEKLDIAWRKRLEKAWDETEGQVLMYEEELALVPFHQVSNGKTRIGAEVLKSDQYPYLQMKECPKDVEAETQMKSVFIDVKNVKVETTDSAGYVLTVTTGEEKVSAENFRETYQLASTCFELQEFEKNTRVVTKGLGHGLGLSQHTANEMAKEGYGYLEILQFFFEGTNMREVAEILWDTE